MKYFIFNLKEFLQALMTGKYLSMNFTLLQMFLLFHSV